MKGYLFMWSTVSNLTVEPIALALIKKKEVRHIVLNVNEQRSVNVKMPLCRVSAQE